MKNWTKYGKPDFMEVAFSAERSIEDEIDRESNAEIPTMVISYAVMFVYITIALGNIKTLVLGAKSCSTLLVRFVLIFFFYTGGFSENNLIGIVFCR